jgi:hypothetical protein
MGFSNLWRSEVQGQASRVFGDWSGLSEIPETAQESCGAVNGDSTSDDTRDGISSCPKQLCSFTQKIPFWWMQEAGGNLLCSVGPPYSLCSWEAKRPEPWRMPVDVEAKNYDKPQTPVPRCWKRPLGRGSTPTRASRTARSSKLSGMGLSADPCMASRSSSNRDAGNDAHCRDGHGNWRILHVAGVLCNVTA